MKCLFEQRLRYDYLHSLNSTQLQSQHQNCETNRNIFKLMLSNSVYILLNITAAAGTNAGSKEQIEQYNRLMLYLDEYKAAIHPLIIDPNLKKFRFNCQKAVNIPVNSIAATSSEHLRDKFDKITQLLAGNQIYSGDIRFSAAEHPLGIQYCTLLLAKKFIVSDPVHS